MKAVITRAAIKAAEILYKQYVAGDTSNQEDLLYILLSVNTVGLDNTQRYKDMLCVILADSSVAEAFRATYDIPRLPIVLPEWPEVATAVAPSQLVSEEDLLIQKKAERVLAINKLRDSKIDSGFIFAGHEFQSKSSDRENIMGVSIAAKMAIESGAQPGNYRWADSSNDFVWITLDNNLVHMDAYDVIGLYQTGMQFKSNLTFKARQLKDEILALETVVEVLAYEEVW